MRKIIAILPALVFYYMGDLAAKILNTGWFESDDSRVGMRLAEFYQWSMIKSFALDNWGNCELWWKAPNEGGK